MNNEDDKIIKRFIIILVIIILVAILIYAITKYAVKKDTTSSTSNETTNEVSVDNSVAIIGTMLKKSASEYYVLIYSKTSTDASTYTQLVTNYKKESSALPIYTVDLSNALNSKYYDSNNTNTTSDSLENLKLS